MARRAEPHPRPRHPWRAVAHGGPARFLHSDKWSPDATPLCSRSRNGGQRWSMLGLFCTFAEVLPSLNRHTQAKHEYGAVLGMFLGWSRCLRFMRQEL
mmetsp:Transcript_131392/g.256013  ORF Transcript_131392/g.256013 Transcript_131392/m.256013 type:complete len:98 (-) Transcript_131392:314-607(-)